MRLTHKIRKCGQQIGNNASVEERLLDVKICVYFKSQLLTLTLKKYKSCLMYIDFPQHTGKVSMINAWKAKPDRV